MLFTAITRRKVYQDPFTCWICLEEEKDPTNQKKLWYRHSCGCNLQLHKRCYLTLVYKSIKEIITYLPERLQESQLTEEYIKGSLSSFIYHNGFKQFQSVWWLFKQTMFELALLGVEITVMSLFTDLKARARARTTFRSWDRVVPITEDTLPEMFKKNPGNMPKCPQCKKDILEGKDMDFIHQPFLFRAYDKFLEYADYLSFIGSSILVLGNPMVTLLELGLWQLRCIFPESQLRYILNLETTKSIDVYLKSFKGITNITSRNKFLIVGLPLFLYSTTYGAGPRSLVSMIIQVKWYRVFKNRIMNYKRQGINLNLLYKCFSCSTLLLSSYTILIKPIVNFLLIPKHIEKSILSQEKDEENGKITLNKYFAKTSENELSLFAQSSIWPLAGKFVGKLLYSTYISLKRYYNLHDTDIVPGFYASSDEYQMIFTLVGMGIVGLSSSIFSRLAWINRQERKLQTEAMVDEIIDETEY